MTIGILIFSHPTEDQHTCCDRLEEAIVKRGHNIVKLYEPFLSFISPPLTRGDKGGSAIRILHQSNPLPPIDVIICRPNFIAEPSLHTYAPDLLAQAGYRVVNGGAAILGGKNKIAQHVMCSAHNIPCPRWGIIQKSDDALAIAREIGFPVILKVAFGTHGKGVFYAQDSETLQPIVEYLAVRDHNPIIIEEFVAEAGRKDLRIFLLGGEVVAAMERMAPEGDVRANTSNGGTGAPVVLGQAEHDLAVRAAKLFSLDIAGVDIIRSNRGPLLLEVNANPGFKELERVTGVDVAGAIVDFVSTKSSPFPKGRSALSSRSKRE